MQQYFIQDKIEQEIIFNEEQAHHIRHVMRMKEKTLIKAVDSNEQSALYEVIYRDGQVVGKMTELLDHENAAVKIYLLMAFIKKDKWDICIQKACECGAYAILPYECERCVAKIADEKIEKKQARWKKIALEACEQAKHNHLCDILEPVSFEKAVEFQADLKLIAYENADTHANNLAKILKQYHPQTVALMIGPEGGFSNQEVEKAVAQGFKAVSLGQGILRAETAAMAGISMLKYQYEIVEEANGTIE